MGFPKGHLEKASEFTLALPVKEGRREKRKEGGREGRETGKEGQSEGGRKGREREKKEAGKQHHLSPKGTK